ncbi:MAG: thioredoxin domain-containing protein, partial [Chloroflexi bacterium]|nr:thioredoxin domain-containing protein [Chloroflexota bacterium]
MPNRLINETSPYLLQHANNPVDWYPWGQEALDRAKAEDKPILLSVGYSACHWCHVMERESFEDPQTAKMMNDNFVSIKVDREERPDIDSIYMTAVQALAGQGGWPMTVFLTPDGKPFYGGTYFPPEDRQGMPGFRTVLQAMASAYQDKRDEVIKATDQLVQHMRQVSQSARSLDPLTTDVMYQAYRSIAGQFDDINGGMGVQPKFPQPMTYEFLLRTYLRSQDAQAFEIVELTLDRMAFGGIYDQIGGGFHRYSTDALWLVPHFEKMLYDNALLVKLYLHAYQVTGKPLYRRIVEETLDYVVREMTDPSGGFYSAQDADSEGVEGKFFVWTPEQIIDVLGDEDAAPFMRYYGVTQNGNFEGSNILHVDADPAAVAREAGITEEALDDLLSRSKARLLEARGKRIHPQRDDKILTAWNGLMLRAFAEASGVLGRPDYAEAAIRNANFLLESLRPEGRLLRTYKAGNGQGTGQAKLNGYLEDYAFLIDGLIVLHEVTFDERWLREAISLGKDMVNLFWDEALGQFYDTGHDHEELIVRPRDTADNAIPSGSSMATDVLLRLAVITGESDYHQKAVTALRSVRELMSRYPTGAGH